MEIIRENNLRNVFLSSEINRYNNIMCELGRKNTCFFGNAQPKSNARAHLKQRKNIVTLCLLNNVVAHIGPTISKSLNLSITVTISPR